MPQATCHPDRPHKARGLCKPCWAAARKAELAGAPRPAPATSTDDSPAAAATASPLPRQPKRAIRPGTPVCPDDGTVLILTTADGRLRCHHQGHDGRPATHPEGPAPQTRAVFSIEEIEAAAKAVFS